MTEIYHLQEYRIRKEIKETEEALSVAKQMVYEGVSVPGRTFDRLEGTLKLLELELINFVEIHHEAVFLKQCAQP